VGVLEDLEKIPDSTTPVGGGGGGCRRLRDLCLG
jgi:hypothetical protein